MILFLNHKEQKCGVYQYGRRTADIITKSQKYDIMYVEIDNLKEYQHNVDYLDPDVVIYNYYPSTMPWLSHPILDSNRARFKQLAIFHEVPITGFDYYIHVDPTMVENDVNFSVGRPLVEFHTEYSKNPIPVIGSFGFGFGNKGYDFLIRWVDMEFKDAIVNLHIPFAAYGDKDGLSALNLADYCRHMYRGSGIQLNITHDFMSTTELLEFLASNTLNAFLYDESYGRGPASTLDYALSVRRPIAITQSYQFEHVKSAWEDICIPDNSMIAIIAKDTKPLEPFYESWSSENLIKDYEHILDIIIGR